MTMVEQNILPLSKFIGTKFSLSDASLEFAMDDDEAEFTLEVLKEVEWSDPVCVLKEFTIKRHHAWDEGENVGLFQGDSLIGFYEGPNLWIHPDYRGRGLAVPLILTAARLRGGSVLPPGFDTQGYSPAGLLAHIGAHLQVVLCAVKNKTPIPEDVLREYNIHDPEEFVEMFGAKTIDNLTCCPPAREEN
jgi:hypothetical protein